MRSRTRPASQPVDVYRDHRTLGSIRSILRVTVREEVGGMAGLFAVGDDTRRAVGSHPPELAPVVLVVVHENGDRGIGRDVFQSLEVRRDLWFGVDREVQSVAVKH